jgi:hypothetical protein
MAVAASPSLPLDLGPIEIHRVLMIAAAASIMASKLASVLSPQGDPFVVLELAEEVLDQVAPPIEVGVDRAGLCPPRVLGDHHLRTSRIQFGDGPIDVEGPWAIRPPKATPLMSGATPIVS